MSEADFQPLVEWLRANPSWILFSVFLISFVESLALAGIIVPGVLLLFLVAVVSGNMSLALHWVLLAGLLGAVLGDGISFYLGRYFKDSLYRVWPFSRYPEMLKKGEHFFEHHGGKSVMIGRFIGPIRPVIPIVVGMLGMSPARFAFFNVASAILWAPAYILPGYLTGKASSWVSPEYFYEVTIGVALSFVGLIVALRYLSQSLQHEGKISLAIRSYNANSLVKKILNGFTLSSASSPPNNQQEWPLASFSLFLFSGISFLIWSAIVVNTDWLSDFDQFINQFIFSLRETDDLFARAIGSSAIMITMLGDEAFLYISFTCLVIFLMLNKHYRIAISMACGGLATAAITHSLKNLWMIDRPNLINLPPDSFAFPSGHTSGTTVLFGLLAGYIAHSVPPKKRWQIYTIGFTPIFLVALSRVILNVHWFSDIVGGLLLGLTICGATRVLFNRFTYLEQIQPIKLKGWPIIATTGWICALIVYQIIKFPTALEDYRLL